MSLIAHLVHLDVELVVLLEALVEFLPVETLILRHALEHVKDSRQHTLKSTEVDVRTVLEEVEHLLGVLLDLVLDVHLATILVLLLARDGVVDAELVRETLSHDLELVVVQLGVAVRNTHEEPRESTETEVRHVFEEHASQVRAEWRNAGSRRAHDVHAVRVLLGQEQDLARRSRERHLRARLAVAEEVGADALLRRVLLVHLRAPVRRAANAKAGRLAVEVVSVARRRDGVEADSVRHLLALGVQFGSRRNYSVALSLPEWRLSIRLEDDVARLTRRLGSDDALARLHLDDERLLGRIGVERHLLGLLELERHLGELSGRRRDGGDRDGLGHGRAARRVDL
mmetsp:Transcript_13273/g.30373  ORF Transcript_13273/g.30373 Transcript_13273/m.30373 type:complete len:342 (+) Transcript_13273:116-1141(+)